VSIVVTALALFLILELVRPYMLILLISGMIAFVVMKVVNQSRRW
jgi:predicted PurR-regulated permease PerM